MTDYTRLHKLTLLITFIISTCMAYPALADGKNDVGKGTATLGNVYQGKVYCPLQHRVVSPFSGEISEKYALVGQKVKKDDVLLKISLQDKDKLNLESRIDNELVILQTNMTIKGLERSIDKLQAQKKDSQELLQEGMVTAKTITALDDEIAFQELKLKQSKTSLAKVTKNLKEQRALISEQLGQKVINSVPDYALVKAPSDGYIIWENTTVRVGAMAGGHVFTIGTMDPMLIRIQMYEADVFNLEIGDTAEVILEFAPKRVRKATVKAIAWMPLSKGIDSPSYYLVELETANPDIELKEGYKVRVMFPEKK